MPFWLLLLSGSASRYSTPMTLFDLPPELIISILSMLPLSDLAACLHINRSLNTLIKESMILQYLIEAQAAGVENCPGSHFSLPARLDILKVWSHSWLSFAFPNKRTITVALDLSELSWLHDFTDGVFLHSDVDSCPTSRPNSTGIKYVSLASVSAPLEHVRWCKILVGREIIGWAALPKYNFIALTTLTSLDNGQRFYRIEIVIVELSTGTYHTAVTEPVIYVTDSRQNINYSKMDISGDILGMWISRCCVINDTPYDVFYLYNWKTGMLKANRDAPTSNYGDFLLLSSDIFLLVNVQEWCFELYTFESLDGRGTKLLTLMLPPLAADYHAVNLACRNSSLSVPTAPHDGQTQREDPLHLGDCLPFHVTANNAIALFKFSISDHRSVYQYILVTHRHSLLSTLSNPIAMREGQILWQDWGPPVTRWIHSPLDVYRATITKGQRFAAIQSVSGLDDYAPIYIFDFNPFLVRRLLLNPGSIESPTSMTRVVSGRELLKPQLVGNPFAAEVWSELPYVECSSKEQFDYSYVFIDEERIVGMKMDPGGSVVERIDVLY